ncbi:MAG: bifunctional diguanylate cyclase/phosphodiesterase [Gammaproteobacteria bacterium]|nr:bifunctional diguanylate cyclase/phosphodiesterase [Gammaproteobacteria bacterium]
MTNTSRRQFLKKLGELAELISTSSLELYAGLLLIDIKGFRHINSVFGLEKGDYILMETSKCLNETFPSNIDIFRIGNDEFAIILPQLINSNLINIAADKVAKSLTDHYQKKMDGLMLSVNIGTACIFFGDDTRDILSTAEQSLDAAKRSGRTYLVQDFSEQQEKSNNYHLMSEIHHALSNNELELYYQPKIDLVTGKPSHAEALARWVSPSLGSIPPDIFIPIIEQIGRMEDLTKWALNTALRQLSEWPEHWGELSVAVNICPSLVSSSDLLNFVSNAVSIWNVSPDRLTLEVTESAIINDKESGFKNLSGLKELGVKISIDDFGTGYSSFSYFKSIPADELKIDKSFICNLDKCSEDQHISQVIVDLANKFNLSVVAEGVETKEVLYHLIDYKCNFAQGYYFSRPLPQNKFIEWLNSYDKNKYF